jgi:hypothetical protein
VTQPTNVFDSKVGDESVFVIAFARHLMTEDVLAGIAANDQAEHDFSTFTCCLHFGVVGIRQVGPVLEALLGHVEIVKADYGNFVVAAGMRATLFT